VKITSISVLLKKNFKLDKKFYYISGNEITLMEKIKKIIFESFKENEKSRVININTIGDFVDEGALFEEKKIFFCKSSKGVNSESLDSVRNSDGFFVFLEENSPKTKGVKNLFAKERDSYSIDCYELDRDSRAKVLNEYIKINNFNIDKDVYWLLVDKLQGRYIFLENILQKIKDMNISDITIENIKKVLTTNDSNKEKIFFNLLKKNKEIIGIYRDKIITNADVSEFYYYSKFFCQLIIDCNTEEEYNKKIPIYLFKEKKFLVDLYRKYNSKKKKLLLELLSTTEKLLRKNSDLSLLMGLRFLLKVKRITIS
tara:strand:- start:413 stop:1351 length:939 start_codon:yes stop_codon:yes gene_type:complete